MSRAGQPLKSDDERRSEYVRLRTRKALRVSLEKAAASSGRSLSEEAERRLEASFELTDHQAIVREEVERAFAREAMLRSDGALGSALPNMSDSDRADWLRN